MAGNEAVTKRNQVVARVAAGALAGVSERGSIEKALSFREIFDKDPKAIVTLHLFSLRRMSRSTLSFQMQDDGQIAATLNQEGRDSINLGTLNLESTDELDFRKVTLSGMGTPDIKEVPFTNLTLRMSHITTAAKDLDESAIRHIGNNSFPVSAVGPITIETDVDFSDMGLPEEFAEIKPKSITIRDRLAKLAASHEGDAIQTHELNIDSDYDRRRGLEIRVGEQIVLVQLMRVSSPDDYLTRTAIVVLAPDGTEVLGLEDPADSYISPRTKGTITDYQHVSHSPSGEPLVPTIYVGEDLAVDLSSVRDGKSSLRVRSRTGVHITELDVKTFQEKERQMRMHGANA